MSSKAHKTYFICTFGCQMNEHDSLKIGLLLAEGGYSETDSQDTADLVIFNTCTIREKAYQKAISEIGRAKEFKRRRPGQIIAVCGCVAQQSGHELFKRFPHVDIVFGPDQIGRLPELIAHTNKGATATALNLINTQDEYDFISEVPDQIRGAQSFVTVSKGCSCQCTYCIVPSVRGEEVSRPCRDVVSEIRNLVGKGVKEVTLLGQNVTSYQSDEMDLANLIRKISEETKIERIRFTSPHPKDVSDSLIEEFAKNPALCPHIHLPAQSGSNKMLKRMGRGYTRERYLEIVKKLRKASPEISITSDFIAGFCGEDDDDFADTVDLINTVQYDSIFAFRYSVRPGTPAEKHFKDDVPHTVKEERLETILSLQRKITLKKNEELVGRVCEVLVTGPDRKKSGRLMGRLANNRIVNFAGNDDLIGRIVSMRLSRALANSMEGELVS